MNKQIGRWDIKSRWTNGWMYMVGDLSGRMDGWTDGWIYKYLYIKLSTNLLLIQIINQTDSEH